MTFQKETGICWETLFFDVENFDIKKANLLRGWLLSTDYHPIIIDFRKASEKKI